MKCPFCGTPIEEGLDVCPACHTSLDLESMTGELNLRWCESCGSPIPEGLYVCPQCGLPMQGAFDDVDLPVAAFGEEGELEGEPALEPLISAIPPTSPTGDEAVMHEERARRARMIVVTLVVALLVVGGTTLYITRPWDPNAYAIHSFEDADTSMAGFPGHKTHLTGQDISENSERVHAEQQMLDRLDEFKEDMATACKRAEVAKDELDAFIAGQAIVIDRTTLSAHSLRQRFVAQLDEVKALETVGTAADEPRELLLGYADYLMHAIDILDEACTLASHETDRTRAMSTARSTMLIGADGYGYDEWHELFVNAYKTL